VIDWLHASSFAVTYAKDHGVEQAHVGGRFGEFQMIFVDRARVPVPEVLTSPRADRAREKIRSLLSSSSKAHLDQLRPMLESWIWIKARPALEQLFFGKCAYCESPVTHFDVDQFRPKQLADFQSRKREPLYYVWLAYDWENLLMACVACNMTKGAFFPVTGPRAPILKSIAECRVLENGTLLDPCFDRPREHLAFDEGGFCHGITDRGDLTIRVLHLNREALVEQRRKKWRETTASVAWMVGRTDARQELENLFSDKQAYAAVVRTAVEQFRGDVLKLAPEMTVPRDVVEPESQETPDRPPKYPRFPGRKALPPFAYEHIRRVEVRDFKSIESLDIDFPDSAQSEGVSSVMLLGENATGKSSVLEAITLALMGTKQIARLGLRPSDYIRRDNTWRDPAPDDPPAVVRVFFQGWKEDEQIAGRRVTVDYPPVSLTIGLLSGFEGNESPTVVLLGYGPRRFFVEGEGAVRSSLPFAHVRTLFRPTAVIRDPTYWLMHCSEDLFNLAVRALRPMLMLPDEGYVSRPPQQEAGTDAAISLEIDGMSTPIVRLSEGYKTVVAMSVDIMREMLQYWPDLESARGVVLIDEIETHLHPRWKMRIVQRLRSAMPQVQFVATTHDPLCLRGLFDGEVKVLRKLPGGGIEQLTELPGVKGLSVEQLLMSDFFGLFSTEDPEFEDEVASYVSLAAKRDRTPAEETELAQQRAAMQARLRAGATPEQQLVQEAAAVYLREERVTESDRAALRREAVERIVNVWKSLEPRET
jgi:hypothetical protein